MSRSARQLPEMTAHQISYARKGAITDNPRSASLPRLGRPGRTKSAIRALAF
jgi:hypothetical protein